MVVVEPVLVTVDPPRISKVDAPPSAGADPAGPGFADGVGVGATQSPMSCLQPLAISSIGAASRNACVNLAIFRSEDMKDLLCMKTYSSIVGVTCRASALRGSAP